MAEMILFDHYLHVIVTYEPINLIPWLWIRFSFIGTNREKRDVSVPLSLLIQNRRRSLRISLHGCLNSPDRPRLGENLFLHRH